MSLTLAASFIITLIFAAGTLWPHPASVLAAGALSATAGIVVGVIRRQEREAHELVSEHVTSIGKTMTLSELRTASEMRPEDDVAVHCRMPVFLANPRMQTITGAYTCVLNGQRVLVLEHDAAVPIPESVEELF